MYISRLDWDDYRIEHITQHDVEPDEVWEVCEDPLNLARRQGHNRYRVYGQTADGRYLFVVLEHIKGTVYKPITTRNMTDREKRNHGIVHDHAPESAQCIESRPLNAWIFEADFHQHIPPLIRRLVLLPFNLRHK